MKPTKNREKPYIEVANRQDLVPVDVEWLRQFAEKALHVRGDFLFLSIALVDDREIKKLHKEFLDDDSPTDVITFDFRDDRKREGGKDCVDAEIVISAEMAKRESKNRKVSLQQELSLYCLHGILHLAGLRDETDEEKQKMRSAERELCQKLGIPYAF